MITMPTRNAISPAIVWDLPTVARQTILPSLSLIRYLAYSAGWVLIIEPRLYR